MKKWLFSGNTLRTEAEYTAICAGITDDTSKVRNKI